MPVMFGYSKTKRSGDLETESSLDLPREVGLAFGETKLRFVLGKDSGEVQISRNGGLGYELLTTFTI